MPPTSHAQRPLSPQEYQPRLASLVSSARWTRCPGRGELHLCLDLAPGKAAEQTPFPGRLRQGGLGGRGVGWRGRGVSGQDRDACCISEEAPVPTSQPAATRAAQPLSPGRGRARLPGPSGRTEATRTCWRGAGPFGPPPFPQFRRLKCWGFSTMRCRPARAGARPRGSLSLLACRTPSFQAPAAPRRRHLKVDTTTSSARPLLSFQLIAHFYTWNICIDDASLCQFGHFTYLKPKY